MTITELRRQLRAHIFAARIDERHPRLVENLLGTSALNDQTFDEATQRATFAGVTDTAPLPPTRGYKPRHAAIIVQPPRRPRTKAGAR